MLKTAKVIINNPSKAVDKAFDYIFDTAVIGDHVIVPFGKGNTLTDGVVIGFGNANEPEKLKKIHSLAVLLLQALQYLTALQALEDSFVPITIL